MLDVEDFDTVFAGLSYSDGIVQDIHANRQALHGRTFFERLLQTLNIKGTKIYPPKTPQQLHDLHQRIVSAPINLHYKHCLVFYLLKDLSPLHHETTELATAFARDVHLEKRFWTFIEGLWELDHLHFETAVGNLTHPSIIPTFPDEIMLTLLRRNDRLAGVGFASDNAGGDDIIPLAYYNCVKPPLIDDEVKREFVRYLSGRNVSETYSFIRVRPAHEQKRLLEILIEETLETCIRDPDNAYTRQEKAMELISLPFDDEEEDWIEKFLTEGKGRTFRGAQDTVLMRKIATGKLRDVSDYSAPRGQKKIEGVNWEILTDGVAKGLGARKDEKSFVI